MTRRRWLAMGLAVSAAALVLAAGVLFVSRPSARPTRPEFNIRLRKDATAADVGSLQQYILHDSRVEGVYYVSSAEVYDRISSPEVRDAGMPPLSAEVTRGTFAPLLRVTLRDWDDWELVARRIDSSSLLTRTVDSAGDGPLSWVLY